MNKTTPSPREDLVEVYRARDEWQGNLLAGFLRNNGIAAEFPGEPAVNFGAGHNLNANDPAVGLFVLPADAARAQELIAEFLAAATDPAVLEETAAQRWQVDRAVIARLRAELREERQTFRFLGWVAVAFFGAATLLWVLWPTWLKTAAPGWGLRLAMIVLLALGAVLAGNWASRKH
jgi:hypothetical protein